MGFRKLNIKRLGTKDGENNKAVTNMEKSNRIWSLKETGPACATFQTLTDLGFE